MYKDRIDLYRKIEKYRDAKLLVYITGDRQGLETQIHSEVLDFFVDHLDRIGIVPRITLYLYTRGGHTLAAWSIVNLINQFCDELEVVIPSKAHSAGTLLSLGANEIIMTKQATLSPIDPSVHTLLNPSIPGGPNEARYSVNVEAINGFFELAKSVGVTESSEIAELLKRLTKEVHPLVLGQVYRTRKQIRMLGKRLLARHINNEEQIDRVVSFLCSESGSHDYTIFRQEAREYLGLKVTTPEDDLYRIIKAIYDSITAQLVLREPYEPNVLVGSKSRFTYEFPRALIESIEGGSHRFVSKGYIIKRQAKKDDQIVEEKIIDRRIFEGWEHEKL